MVIVVIIAGTLFICGTDSDHVILLLISTNCQLNSLISDRVHERGADVRVDAVDAARPLHPQGAHVPLHRRHGQRRRLLHHGLAHAGEPSMK